MRKLAGAIALVSVVLASSACGSAHSRTGPPPVDATTTATPQPGGAHPVRAHLPPLLPLTSGLANVVIARRQTGTGDRWFGPFTVRGNFMFFVACSGDGSMSIVVPRLAALRHLKCGGDSPTGSMHSGRPAFRTRLHIRATPGTKWEIEIGECVKKPRKDPRAASCETA